MALAGTASGDHPRRRAAPATSARTNGSTCRPLPCEAVDTTGAGDVFAGVLAAGWRSGHEDALRRACAAGALSTLVPGAGDCAPYAEAIDDAVSNRKAEEDSYDDHDSTPRPPDGDWLGTPYLRFTGRARSASARWTGRRPATR